MNTLCSANSFTGCTSDKKNQNMGAHMKPIRLKIFQEGYQWLRLGLGSVNKLNLLKQKIPEK